MESMGRKIQRKKRLQVKLQDGRGKKNRKRQGHYYRKMGKASCGSCVPGGVCSKGRGQSLQASQQLSPHLCS